MLALLAASRLCQARILWEGDALPLATAGQMLRGKTVYLEIWYDKPPLVPAFHLLAGGRDGWPLRLVDALYALLACWIAFGFARAMWSWREGLGAAGLLGFFLIFDFPASVIPVGSDLLMLAPHLAALWLAWKRRPFWCGVMVGVAFWASPKALMVLAVCALWDLGGLLWMGAGFAAVLAVGVSWLAAAGALSAYWEQVWVWGRLYAGSPFVGNPIWNGVVRTANWAGFHAALIPAAAVFLRYSPSDRWKWLAWVAMALVGVGAGMRFFPRYYFILLPVAVLMASRGFVLLNRRSAWAARLLLLPLLIPLVRFAPAYAMALADPAWRDTAMDRDSRAAAALTRRLPNPATPSSSGDTGRRFSYIRKWPPRPYISIRSRSRVCRRTGTSRNPSPWNALRPRAAALVSRRPVHVRPRWTGAVQPAIDHQPVRRFTRLVFGTIARWRAADRRWSMRYNRPVNRTRDAFLGPAVVRCV